MLRFFYLSLAAWNLFDGSDGGLIKNDDPLGSHALNWIQQKKEKATDELTSAKQHLTETVRNLIQDGKIEIDSSVDKALQDIGIFVNDVPQPCHKKATNSLRLLRSSKKNYFLSCVERSNSVRGIVELKERSEDVGAGFFSMTHKGSDRIVECLRLGVFGAYQCGASAIWEVVKNVMNGYSEIKRFIVAFTARGTHARKDIHDCLHPEGIDIQDHVDKIMADYHTCVRISRSAKTST